MQGIGQAHNKRLPARDKWLYSVGMAAYRILVNGTPVTWKPEGPAIPAGYLKFLIKFARSSLLFEKAKTSFTIKKLFLSSVLG